MSNFCKITVLLVILILFAAPKIFAESWSAKVIGVKDGDTIAVLHEGKEETIRLNGIDCPEKKQAFGSKAKNFTSELVFGKIVNVEPVTKDRYGRTVAKVFIDDKNVNHEIVKNGFAWWYRKYAPDDKELAKSEEEVRNVDYGKMKIPYHPWEFREKESKKKTN